MLNPLIERKALLKKQPSQGRQPGVINRQLKREEEERILQKGALAVLEKHFPKLFIPNCTHYDYPNFQKIWHEKVFQELCNKFPTTSQLAKANNLLTHLINNGNKEGIWHLPVPSVIIRQKRDRPFRDHKWHTNAMKLVAFEKRWLSNIDKNQNDTTALMNSLISCVLHSGLNESQHLEALFEALQQKSPLQRVGGLVWIDLELPPNSRQAKSKFPFSTNTTVNEDTRLLTSRFFPTSISLAFITRYLQKRSTEVLTWRSLHQLLESVFKKNGLTKMSLAQFCKAGVGVVEVKPNIALPQAIVEYSTKKNMAYSLPSYAWLKLFEPARAILEDTRGKADSSFNPSESLSTLRSIKNAQTKFGFINSLLSLVKEKERNQKRTPNMALKEWDNVFPDMDNLPSNEKIFLSWVKEKLRHGKKLSTVRRYVDAIGTLWIAFTREVDLFSNNVDFDVLYQSMLELAVSEQDFHYRAARLEDLHQFAVVNFNFRPLSEPLHDKSSQYNAVRATVVTEQCFAYLLQHINGHEFLDQEEKIQLCAIVIIAYRAGLRISEILKLRLKDVEYSSDIWLFIRNNQYDNNKSSASRRKFPLIPMCTEYEKDILREWLRLRQFKVNRTKHPQQIFVARRYNQYGPPDKLKISLTIGFWLKQITGNDEVVFHSLRHSAFSRLQLVMHWDTMDTSCLPDKLINAIMPYDVEQRIKVRKHIFGLHPQSQYWALAVAAGHNSPQVTFNSYLHFTDLITFCLLQKNGMTIDKQHAINAFPFSVRAIQEIADPQTNKVNMQDIMPLVHDKLSKKSFVRERKSSTVKESVTVVAYEFKIAKRDRRNLVFILHELLSSYQAGESIDMLRFIHKLNDDDIMRWIKNAEMINTLETTKHHARHNPIGRQYSLIPPYPNSHAEVKDILKLLAHLRTMFADNVNTAKRNLAFLSRVILLRTHSNHSAIIFRHQSTLKTFLSLVDCLPKTRWRIMIGTENDATFKRWRDTCKGYELTRYKLKEDKRNPDGQAKVYLSHPYQKEIIEKTDYTKYSSNTLKFVVRLLSIAVFSGDELRKICNHQP